MNLLSMYFFELVKDATPDQKRFCIADINKLCDIGIWITRNGADKNE